MARRSTIEKLPEDVRRWLERALTESGFSGYNELESLLRERGYVISKSAIHRYGQKIERRYGAIRAATEAARMLTEGAADDQDARSEAVIALIQTELFESIVQLQEAEEGEVDPKERVALLSKVAKNVATLSRASVNLKSSSLKYGPERSRQPATPRKLPVRGDCQATQYRRFVARFWGLPHDKIIRSDFKRRWRRPRRDESHGREE